MPLCLCGGALVCSRRPWALSDAASPDPHACAVQLPKDGRCIFLGWEPSGAALAAVQDHGGAFLWFPSKPDCVQQWEGMQFQGSMLSSSSKNAAFHTTFAKWSKTRKLVLGLADGNFACWDLESNETFISRKHFAGKHKNAITCGAWGFGGDILALGSKNQIKVSEPLLNASWEATSAKLELLDNDLALQELEFSPSGQTMSAIAGTSIFRHLCLYGVKITDNGKTVSTTLTPVGEMHPNCMRRPCSPSQFQPPPPPEALAPAAVAALFLRLFLRPFLRPLLRPPPRASVSVAPFPPAYASVAPSLRCRRSLPPRSDHWRHPGACVARKRDGGGRDE